MAVPVHLVPWGFLQPPRVHFDPTATIPDLSGDVFCHHGLLLADPMDLLWIWKAMHNQAVSK